MYYRVGRGFRDKFCCFLKAGAIYGIVLTSYCDTSMVFETSRRAGHDLRLSVYSRTVNQHCLDSGSESGMTKSRQKFLSLIGALCTASQSYAVTSGTQGRPDSIINSQPVLSIVEGSSIINV